MYLYICLVLCVTLMPFRIPLPGIMGTNNLFLESINWVPFRDVIEQNGNAVREVILNIIMMIPFGVLLPQIKKYRMGRTVFCGFLFSLGIETMQLMYVWAGGATARSFDVTDLITNTLGTVIGYCCFKVFTYKFS